MSRVKDLWHSEVNGKRKKTKRHPDNGGSKTAKRWLGIAAAPDGREISKAHRTKDAASAWAKQTERELEDGDYVDPKEGKGSFADEFARWLELRDVSAGTRETYRKTYRNLVEPTFGKGSIGAPRPSDVLKWLRGISRYGPSYVQAAYLIVAGVFDLAVADGKRKDNPARHQIIDRPTGGTKNKRELWTTDVLLSVADAVPHRYRAVVYALACGLRQSEALALGEKDIDLNNRVIHVRRQIRYAGRRYFFKALKGGEAREVPMPDTVARVLREHIAKYPPRPYALPWLGQRDDLGDDLESHVVRLLFRWHNYRADKRSHDQHIRQRSFNDFVWWPACESVGLERNRMNGTHQGRHWYSQTLQDAGVPLAGVMDFLGHSRENDHRLPVTVRVYSAPTPATYEAARRAVDEQLTSLRLVSSGTVTEQAV